MQEQNENLGTIKKILIFCTAFKRDPVAILSFCVLSVLVVISILAPVITPHNTYDTATFDIMDSETPPAWMEGGSESFILGTDIQGRDLLSTMIYGLRVSLLIGVGAVLLQAVVGILVGLLSGYLGGKLDSFLMRIADIQFSIPYLIVAIFTAGHIQAGLWRRALCRTGRTVADHYYRDVGMAQICPDRSGVGAGREKTRSTWKPPG